MFVLHDVGGFERCDTNDELPFLCMQADEADLEMTLAISLFEALTGFNKTVRLLNGSTTVVSRPNKITLTGSSVRIPGAGLPVAIEPRASPFGSGSIIVDPGPDAKEPEFGSLSVVFRVLAPTPLTEAQKAELFRVLGPDKLRLLEVLMRVTAVREAALAGEAMELEETFVSTHCVALDPFSCPDEPAFRFHWIALHPQCTRLADNGIDLQVWGPLCSHIRLHSAPSEPAAAGGASNATAESQTDKVDLAEVVADGSAASLSNTTNVTD